MKYLRKINEWDGEPLKIKPKYALVTNQEVYEHGDEIDNWPCDESPDGDDGGGFMGFTSNSGIEHLIEYQGKRYLIITDHSGEEIKNPDAAAREYKE